MNFDEIQKLGWSGDIENKEKKEMLAKEIAQKVKNGDVISFGSGTTSFLTVKAIGERCQKEGLNIIAIPTSKQIQLLCDYFQIKTAKLGEYDINWGFDGADEVDPNNWLIKGKGAALYKEKMNILKTPIVYILVDESKKVKYLGEKCLVPIECDKNKIELVKNELKKIGAIDFDVRKEKHSSNVFITENGKAIIDTKFINITSDLENKIKQIDGVLESGLFINYNNIEIVEV